MTGFHEIPRPGPSRKLMANPTSPPEHTGVSILFQVSPESHKAADLNPIPSGSDHS